MKKAANTNAFYFIGYVLLILPHMNPRYFELIPSLNTLINVARLASFYFIVMRLFIIRHKISSIALMILGIETYMLLVTVLRRGDVYTHMVNVFSIFSVTLLYDSVDDKPDTFLSALLFCFEIMVYINFVTILMYPDGMYASPSHPFSGRHYYFLDHYNNLDQYFVPTLATAGLYTELTGKRLRTFLIMAVAYASALLVWSAGTLCSLSLILISYVSYVYVKKALNPLLNYAIYWLIHPVFFVSIILLHLESNFTWLTDGILHKRYTFLLRVALWSKTMKLISDYPIFGHGFIHEFIREREAGFDFAAHAHNMLLEILYQGGLVYLLLFTLLVIFAGKELLPYRNTETAQILTIGFLGWCIHTTVEPFMTPFLMGMFVLNCKCGLFESATESRRNLESEQSRTSKLKR